MPTYIVIKKTRRPYNTLETIDELNTPAKVAIIVEAHCKIMGPNDTIVIATRP